MKRTLYVAIITLALSALAFATEHYYYNVCRFDSHTATVECNHQKVPTVRLVPQQRIGGTRYAVEVTCSN
jgi:hypothetical protein